MKPIYIIGHNPNTIEDVKNYLGGGANAIEPDINVASGSSKLCVSHEQGNENTISIDAYFSQINDLLEVYPHLSLIYLDCKPNVVGRGKEILQSVRTHLGSKLKIVLSVSSIKEAEIMFPSLVHDLQENEYLLIDEENDPVAVSQFFESIGAPRFGYANGDSVPLLPTPIFFPHIEKSIASGCWLRDEGKLSFVFTWTFNSKFNQKHYLNLGIDGIIVDLNAFPFIPGLKNIVEILNES